MTLFLLAENGARLLQENGFELLLEQQDTPSPAPVVNGERFVWSPGMVVSRARVGSRG